MVAPVPTKLNALYFNALAEIYRKQGKYASAIKNITLSFDYLKILGENIAKLFCMTRLAELHVQLSASENQLSFISFGDVSFLFEKEISDMLSHIFLETNKMLSEKLAIVSFFISKNVLSSHPEINSYVELLLSKNISPVLLGESFTILPNQIINQSNLKPGKAICIVGNKNIEELKDEYSLENFSSELEKFDTTFQQLLTI